MLKVQPALPSAYERAQLIELEREVHEHVRRKVLIKQGHDPKVVEERIHLAFERAHEFLSVRDVDHYDSYLYLTLSCFLLGDAIFASEIREWLENELIAPSTRVKTLYFLVRKILRGT